jgi:hypothetical protein
VGYPERPTNRKSGAPDGLGTELTSRRTSPEVGPKVPGVLLQLPCGEPDKLASWEFTVWSELSGWELALQGRSEWSKYTYGEHWPH